MKIYGDSKYKGYLLVRDKKTNKVASKHYISSVDHDLFSEKVKIYVRGKQSDMCLDYKIGNVYIINDSILSRDNFYKPNRRVVLVRIKDNKYAY